jgi:hypothetical protein
MTLPFSHLPEQECLQFRIIRRCGLPAIGAEYPFLGKKQLIDDSQRAHDASLAGWGTPRQSFFQFSGRSARTAAPACHISDSFHSFNSFSSRSR